MPCEFEANEKLMSQVPLTFGGGNKNLVEGCTGGGGGVGKGGEMIRFLKGIFQKSTQVNIPNLLNS